MFEFSTSLLPYKGTPSKQPITRCLILVMEEMLHHLGQAPSNNIEAQRQRHANHGVQLTRWAVQHFLHHRSKGLAPCGSSRNTQE